MSISLIKLDKASALSFFWYIDMFCCETCSSEILFK